MHEDEVRVSGSPATPMSYIGSLPEANKIFEVLQHVKKSIYPFEMVSHTHRLMAEEQEPYFAGEGQPVFGGRYKPVLDTIPMHFDRKYVVYDKFNNNNDDQLFNENIYPIDRLKNLRNLDYVTSVELTQPFLRPLPDGLSFDSRFESGNLSLVSYLQGVYHLLLHNDVNTAGYTSWFYFKVCNRSKGRYKFAIMNYGKAGWAHNQGVRICVYTAKHGWRRGGEYVRCEANSKIFNQGKLLKFNTLYFEYEFEEDGSEIYFAYNVPYTYNDLCCLLDRIEESRMPDFHRKLAGISLAGNKIELLTITNFALLSQNIELPVIVLMARAHPGETVSSWIMHQFLKFIVSADPEAKNLRNNFIFKIFPMINPDGVIHGNYRCSLSGRDLNRRWNDPNKELFPEIYFIKAQIMEISKKRNITMILDLHGHTQKKKIFAYGCNTKNEPHRCRLFPYIVSKMTSFFEFKFCNYFMDRSKFGTARITLFSLLKIPYTYTIETSQFGTIEGHLSLKVFQQISHSMAKSFAILFRVKNSPQKQCEAEKYEKQLINDPTLLKIGNEKDDGSDSEPSVDNIKFDRLQKLYLRKSKKIDTKLIFTERFQFVRPDIAQQQMDIKSKREQMGRPKTTQFRGRRINDDKEGLRVDTKLASYKSRLECHNQQRVDRIKRAQSRMPERSEVFGSKRKTQKINLINLSLSIYDDDKSRRNSKVIPGIHMNYRGFNEDLLQKLSSQPRKTTIYRRIN